jgi:hypothetical protein
LKDVEKSLQVAMGVQEPASQHDDVPTDSLIADQEATDLSINYSAESAKEDANDMNDLEDDKKGVEEEEPNDDKVESDAFRIREGDEENIAATTIVKPDETIDDTIAEEGCGEEDVQNSGENESTDHLSPPSETTPSPLSSKVSDLMGKLCVVFSSVFKLAGSDTAENGHPFITLHPSYLRSVNSEDLLFALDEIMSPHASESFSFLSDPVSSSWIDVVRVASNDPSSETSSIPLYMLLLLRFQIAVFDSFRRDAAENTTAVCKEASSVDDKGTMTTSSETDAEMSKNDQSTSASSNESSIVHSEVESTKGVSPAEQSNKVEDSTGEKSSPETEIPLNAGSPSSYSALLPSLLSRLSTLTNIDSAKFCEMMSPLSSSFPQLSEKEQVLENYLIIPILLVAQRLKGLNINFDDGTISIDEAVAEAVKRVEQEFPITVVLNETIAITASNRSSEEVEASAKDDIVNESKNNPAETTAVESAAQHTGSAVNQGPAGKKNSKKKKKRKVCNFRETIACVCVTRSNELSPPPNPETKRTNRRSPTTIER